MAAQSTASRGCSLCRPRHSQQVWFKRQRRFTSQPPKGVPSNRLPVKKAVLAVQALVAESAVRRAILGVLALAQARPVLVAA
jgi:hypothetical protein